MIKNPEPFGKKCMKTAVYIFLFLTHTVYSTMYVEWAADHFGLGLM